MSTTAWTAHGESSPELTRLRERAQSFTEDVSLEGYLAYSGQKQEPAFQAVYEQYADVLDTATLRFCIDQFNQAADDEARRAAQMMLEWQIESQAGRQLAALDEREVALENSAVVQLDDGREIAYQSAAIEIMNTADRQQRNAIDAARAHVAGEQFSPLRLEHLQREKEYIESLHIAENYNRTFEVVSDISLSQLSDECNAFLRDTEAMWTDSLNERLKAFGIPVGEATRADALALFRLKEYDDAFPGSSMQATIVRNCADMGMDATANGRVIFDLADRPGKRSRAFCSPVRVPEEVYLVMRPHGGQTDYNTFLHELGHALHFGYARPDYPFEYRWLGDNSVTESYAMLFDHRMQDRGWLLRYTELGKSRVNQFLRLAAFEELHFLRRYCAKLIYEVQVYAGTLPWQSLPELYTTTLGSATSFQYRPEDAFLDLDPRYYSTRYLRAWQLQAVLNAALTERFNEDWWRNPSAGPWIINELFRECQRERAHEIATRISRESSSTTSEPNASVRALGFAPLIKQVETLLAA
jgi:hypothetical protein